MADPGTSLETNTTDHLIGDLERLREHLGIDRRLVWGGSWGVTLGLAYAQRHPHRVSEMVLASVTMTRPGDVHWLYHEAGRGRPERGVAGRRGGGRAGGCGIGAGHSTFATRVLLQPALHGVTLVPAAKAVTGAFRVATPAVSPGGRRRREAVGERGGGRSACGGGHPRRGGALFQDESR